MVAGVVGQRERRWWWLSLSLRHWRLWWCWRRRHECWQILANVVKVVCACFWSVLFGLCGLWSLGAFLGDAFVCACFPGRDKLCSSSPFADTFLLSSIYGFV